ncbi:unnamed protein product [Caenorhabditis bovis]|uniref:Ubiquitin-like domain-containing protein n=1 Tax=Caenorhabditis bovis TaxID=2654633 RepID=A0A8S1EW32_9PELO|nr:unnamed protein product [Caenorhabditis bovis]
MELSLILNLQDHEGSSHRKKPLNFDKETSVEQLSKAINSLWNIDEKYQELFFNGQQILSLKSTLQDIGVKDDDEIVVKHADLPWWNEYKRCVEQVLKQRSDKVEMAKEAVQYYERLTKSGFFYVYAQFNIFRSQNHTKVAAWTDGDVGLIRKATEQYFHNLHDQKRGNEDSKFTCYFEERDADLGGRPTNTLAFVQIHGEDSVSKYNIKCHHYDPKGSSSGKVPDVSEFYCYKLLSSIGVCPKSHIIPPCISTGTKTSTYIATQWDDRFELLENVIDGNSLCADVVVQLVMLRVLLFISDLHEQNCGRWKGTQHAAIVDFAPTNDFKIYPDIKSELITTFPHKGWEKQYSAVKNQHDDNSWLMIAKVYLDKIPDVSGAHPTPLHSEEERPKMPHFHKWRCDQLSCRYVFFIFLISKISDHKFDVITGVMTKYSKQAVELFKDFVEATTTDVRASWHEYEALTKRSCGKNWRFRSELPAFGKINVSRISHGDRLVVKKVTADNGLVVTFQGIRKCTNPECIDEGAMGINGDAVEKLVKAQLHVYCDECGKEAVDIVRLTVGTYNMHFSICPVELGIIVKILTL